MPNRIVNPSPPEPRDASSLGDPLDDYAPTKRKKRAPNGTFDRKTYQRDLMRKRLAHKKESIEMSGTVSTTFLIGNIGKDAEIKVNPSGGKFAYFSLATSETWKDKSTGERKTKVEWHKIVIFNQRLVDDVERFCKKGKKVLVQGQNRTRTWNDQQGAKHAVTEVVLSPFKGILQLIDDDTQDVNDYENGGDKDKRDAKKRPPNDFDPDSDIPF